MFGRGRNSSNVSQLEREYDKQLQQSLSAALAGRDAEACRASMTALTICRELHRSSLDPGRHRPVLASALYNHAGNLLRVGSIEQTLELLEESGEQYATLAVVDTSYRFLRIDVLVTIGIALEEIGDLGGAVEQFRDAVLEADKIRGRTVEQELGLAKAHFHLGMCLLELQPNVDEGLAVIDEGLFAAERAREAAGISATDFSWLAAAPEGFFTLADLWVEAAVRAMELHEAAGRFDVAADAANIAVRVSGGLAGMGDGELYSYVLPRAQLAWRHT